MLVSLSGESRLPMLNSALMVEKYHMSCFPRMYFNQFSMSLSPGSPAICLETPPVSPSARAAVKLSPDSLFSRHDSLAVTVESPTRQSRRYERGLKRKRIDKDTSPLSESRDLSEDLFWGSNLKGHPPREIERDLVDAESEPADRRQQAGYVDFVDAVLADVAPFYQISRSLFVSTGWSSQTKTTTVSRK
jgi:hypothetical protein